MNRFLKQMGPSFMLQQTVIWFALQLPEFRSKQARGGGGLYVQAITLNLIRKCLVSKQHTQEHIACAKNTTSENLRDNADLIRR